MKHIISLGWHTGWNVLEILWIHFTYASGKDPMQSVCKEKAASVAVTNLLSVTFKSDYLVPAEVNRGLSNRRKDR